ncbi:hypothetical protein TNCV_460901 [Trichonephila clavipes]|nr:hypothetical protein TNCV_460901 [Trichonephila clavipes]
MTIEVHGLLSDRFNSLQIDKADEPISFRSASKGDVARLDFPGAAQNVYIRRESRKDSPRGTTGSRHPSGIPRATLLSYKRYRRAFGNGACNFELWSSDEDDT